MKLKTLALAMTATVASFSASAATPYGDLITNTATLNYTVNGGTTVTAPDAKAEFNVDRLVKFNLSSNIPTGISDAGIGDNTTVGFTLTNNSNASLNYSLPTLTNVIYYNDLDGDGSLDPITEEIPSNVISGLISLVQDDGTLNFSGHVKEFLAVFKPLQGVDGDAQDITFEATAVENDSALGTVGSTIVPTPLATPWDEDVIQTVAEFDADGNFITTQSETITFTFKGANISLQKTVEVVSDPVSLSANAPAGYTAKAIPGAILKYTITVTNSGSKDAALSLGDTMPSIFSVTDIVANSYEQSINGAAATLITPVSVAPDTDGNVAIVFPGVTATAVNASVNGTVVTTFEVKLP